MNPLENGLQVDFIYEDFSKAFDTVNQKILIYKLKIMKFDDVFVKWIEFITDAEICKKPQNLPLLFVVYRKVYIVERYFLTYSLMISAFQSTTRNC